MSWPVVLTSTFRPDPRSATVLYDEPARVRQYATTLDWVTKNRFGHPGVVLVENSGAESAVIGERVRRLQSRGLLVEFHQLNEAIPGPFRGKGWGEGRMLEQVLETSPLLGHHDAFVKITGRLRIVNLRRLSAEIQHLRHRIPSLAFVAQSYVMQPHPFAQIQFFWARRDFFRVHLADAYRSVDDDSGRYLEHALADRLLALADDHPIYVLDLPVIIDGINAWSGQPVQARHRRWRLLLAQFMRRKPALTPLSQWPGRDKTP